MTKNDTKTLAFTTLGFKKIDSEKIYIVNPLYLLIDHASGYIEEGGANKYLIFVSTDKKKVTEKILWCLEWN